MLVLPCGNTNFSCVRYSGRMTGQKPNRRLTPQGPRVWSWTRDATQERRPYLAAGRNDAIMVAATERGGVTPLVRGDPHSPWYWIGSPEGYDRPVRYECDGGGHWRLIRLRHVETAGQGVG